MEKESKIRQNGLTKPTLHLNLGNITYLNLSFRNIEVVENTIVIPETLTELNISNNNLKEVPAIILNLKNLKLLDLSHNNIEYFDDTPKFCHTIERLNLASNKLKGPPNWVWTASPQNLIHLDLSHNPSITYSLTNGYFEELLQYTNSIKEINIQNCALTKHLDLLGTCTKIKSLCLGSESCYNNVNNIIDLPFIGLEKCCDIERLNVSNTCIHNISKNIDIFKNIIEINISYNKVHCLPNEFCNLANLEICVLSYNKLLYLPEDITKLHKLKVLLLDNNDLCMIPNNIFIMPNLRTLDLYNNYINEIPGNYSKLEELDFAQNYAEEPVCTDYMEKRFKFRMNSEDRLDGRKIEVEKPESLYSDSSLHEDEEYYEYLSTKTEVNQNNNEDINEDLSENWDSDEYWIPCYQQKNTPSTRSPWIYFIKKKLEDGNFCPIDNHAVSVMDKVRYERLCNPPVVYESDGQFDDYSSDDT